jgi:hypothetical protein
MNNRYIVFRWRVAVEGEELVGILSIADIAEHALSTFPYPDAIAPCAVHQSGKIQCIFKSGGRIHAQSPVFISKWMAFNLFISLLCLSSLFTFWMCCSAFSIHLFE